MGSLKNLRILLADDDPDDRELFAEAIESHDTEVDSVPNGIQLMENLSQNDALPDLVFIDLNMPEKSGKECLSEIRNHERLKDIPVIIYSTSSSRKDIDDTFELGANLYITKPNSFSELKKALRKILQIDWSEYRPKSHYSNFVYSKE